MNRLMWELIIIIALVIIAPAKAVDMGEIYSGETIVGDIAIKGQTDSFAFYGTAGQGVVIEEGAINGSLGSAIYLYRPNGTIETSLIGGRFATRARIENYQLKETGLYTIVITASGAEYTSLTGEYGLSFTKIPSTPSPGIYNPFPADKTRISNLNQSFKWDAVPDATGYDLYFGEDVITPLIKLGENLSSPEMAFPVMEMNKIYYWHVEAHTPNSTIYGPYWWFYTRVSNLTPISICGPDKLRCENVGAPLQLNGAGSYDPDGFITSYAWEFGDGTNGTGASPKHTYSTYRWNGTAYKPFTVNLTVTDNSGLMNTTSQKVVIWIAGDANGDGNVNILDASIVGLKWGTNDACADLNNDGKVNIIDASIIGLNWGKKP